MEVTYVLTPDDLWAFHQFQTRRKPLVRLFNDFGTVAMSLVWLLSLWTNVRRFLFWWHIFGSVPQAWSFYWAYRHTSLLLFVAYTVSLIYLTWGGRLLFLYQKRSAKAGRTPAKMCLYSDAILVTTASRCVRLAWQDIREIAGTRAHLFFYTGETTAVVVPKRAFVEGAVVAFETAARAFKSNPIATTPNGLVADVWPPPPSQGNAPVAPVPKEDADPPGTREIAYVTRRSDAWRSASHSLITHPGAILLTALPLLFSALLFALATHAEPGGYESAFSLAVLVTALLILYQTHTQLKVRYPARESERACVSKIRPDAYIDISPNGRTVLPWRNVSAVTLVLGDLYVRRNDTAGVYFIPRTAFSTPAEARAALEAMQRYHQQALANPTVGVSKSLSP